MALEPGRRLGSFEILSPLGAGGMGEVYRARDTRLDRTVAIKVLPAHLSGNAELRQRFEREARTISSLSHPHVCTLYDVGHEDGVDFLVMEYVEGETLASRVARGPLPAPLALRCGIEIAEALSAAHRHGVVHRDLKPGNVMLTKSGTKLLDFGLAKYRRPDTGADGSQLSALPTAEKPLTGEGRILGTLPYMAPEQLESRETDARSDIWALGCILHEMATGKRAFEGKSQASLIASIIGSEPPRVSSVQHMAPPALDHVVRRCLAKDPEERWQAARDVASELAWIAETASGAQGPAPASRLRGAWLPWGVATLATAAAVVLALWTLHSPEPRPAVRFLVHAPQGWTFSFAGRDAGPVTVSPGGTRLAFVATSEEGRKLLFVRPLGELDAKPLSGTDGASYPFWSPDSRFLGFFAEGKLKRVDGSGGPIQVLCDAPLGRGGAWNRDGTIVFAPASESALHRVSAAGGSASPVTRLKAGSSVISHRWPSFLPDGRRFLYVGFNSVLSGPEAGNSIFVGSLDSEQGIFLFKSQSKAEYVEGGQLLFAQGRVLLAAPFDPDRLRLVGQAVPIAERLRYFPNTASAVFSVSRNGVLAYQTGEILATSQLVWFDRSGNRLGTVGPPSEPEDPRISPDGKTVAVNILDPDSGISNVWLYELARGTASRFTFAPTIEHSPVWAPDGSRIAYDSFRTAPVHIYEKALAGSGDGELLVESPRFKTPTDWSRDGRSLIYQSLDPATGWDVWFLPVGGDRKPVAFLRSPFNEMNGQLSPDGRWMAYTSDESGSWEVYVAAFPGPGRKWQVSRGGGSQAIWRRDGRELFYLSRDRDLTAVEVEAGEEFRAGPPRTLFRTRARYTGSRAYDVTPGGERFLISTVVVEEAPEPITVVLGWRPRRE